MDINEFTRVVRPSVLANRSYNKIFGIGGNKTGTTSLEMIFRIYGFNCPNQQEQEIRTVKQAYLGNYAPLVEFVEKFDAFQDQPFSQGEVFVAADALFPGSKFILTERDPEAWFDSMMRFHKKTFGIEGEMSDLTEEDILTKFAYLYPGYDHFVNAKFLADVEDGEVRPRWDKLYDKDFYIQRYIERNNRIKRYFDGRPDTLLVVDFEEQTTTDEICYFLDIPEKFAIKVPHLNSSK